MEEFWKKVMEILTGPDDEEGYELDENKVRTWIHLNTKDPEVMADFIYDHIGQRLA